ncbi:flagellar assembly protein FliH [Campylobacter sp. TTU-622]|uniref:flagellar assembly protein FliH n=1 Tax=Campylobacter sp. TTU-622 TaxID=2800583 RepID=UPI001902FD67|nr:flagellar assembly protein FliH [Campylobacter sp. TTU-622]MBK1972809.1 flagellar assembly protein FliH [Campylobacter sp. TTU-622]
MTNRSNVISKKDNEQHVVEGYRFKVISEFNNEQEKSHINTNNEIKNENEIAFKEEQTQTILKDNETTEEKQIDFQPSFVEDLLKKTDEMSSNIIKLQMQIENQENEFNNRLNSELENAKEKFTQEGYNNAKIEFEKELNELKERYLKSILKLDEASKNLDSFIEKNKKELADTAIDIAKEVILKEVEDNSSKIAYSLAKDLISELKGAGEIDIRVNCNDYDYLKSEFKNDLNIKITLDDAISKGSVVILSDLGNIESSLNQRLEKIKRMINNE